MSTCTEGTAAIRSHWARNVGEAWRIVMTSRASMPARMLAGIADVHTSGCCARTMRRHANNTNSTAICQRCAIITDLFLCVAEPWGSARSTAVAVGQRFERCLGLPRHVGITPAWIGWSAPAIEHLDHARARPVEVQVRI